LAVLIIIASSVLGWIMAACALVAGMTWFTAALAFFATSLVASSAFLIFMTLRETAILRPH